MSAPEVMIEAEKVASVLGTLSTFDFKGAIAAFRGEDPEVKIDEALLTAEDVAKIVGLFIPEAATAAEWIDVARVVLPIVIAVSKRLPPAAQPGPDEISVWGHVFSNKGLFQ